MAVVRVKPPIIDSPVAVPKSITPGNLTLKTTPIILNFILMRFR